MSGGQLGVLHTDSSYMFPAPPLPYQAEDTRLLRLQLQIASLKGMEDEFAGRFGYSSILEMIQSIRQILNQVPNDMKALQQFSSINLRKHLEQFKTKYGQALKGQKIHLVFTNVDKNEKQLRDAFHASGGNGSISYVIDGELHIDCEWNTNHIKNLINKVKGTHFQTINENIDYLRGYILHNSDTFIDVVEGTAKRSMEQYLIETNPNPFSLTKEQVNELAKNNPSLLAEFEQKIKNFIYDELCNGASGEFKNAVQTVMGQKMSQLTDISFFMSGNNINNVVGAFGELQTAIMFQYIANKTPNKLAAAKITSIIGDMTNEYGQQLHSDLEIFNAFGVQVKNYNGSYNSITGAERTVAVHLHPSEVAALGASEGVVDYIANSYFNTSIAPYPLEELNQFFKSHASELLNLDLNPTINNQVVFYMIGGNFIPGSAILEAAFATVETAIKVNTTISGQMGMSDAEYNTGDASDWNRPFHKWWQSNNYGNLVAGQFTPTGKNSVGAWDSKISITTTFTYSALLDGAYNILG